MLRGDERTENSVHKEGAGTASGRESSSTVGMGRVHGFS